MTLHLGLAEKKDLVDVYRKLLLRKDRMNQMTVRDEYREHAVCAWILLGEIPQSGKIGWRKPGACHRARSEQLDLEDETKEGLAKLCRFTPTTPYSIWGYGVTLQSMIYHCTKKLFA
jgi:hypothetical protein